MRGILFPRLLCPNHPYTVVVTIRNVEVPLRIHLTSMWPVQAGGDGWSIVTSTAAASPGDGRDHTSHRVNQTNGMVLGVHNQQVAVMVTPNGLGAPQVAVSAGLRSPL